MKEDFVSYDQALRLKKLGFDWECIAKYGAESDGKPILVGSTAFVFRNSEEKGRDVTAPTLSQAQKWLRDEKELHVQVAPCRDSKTEKISWRMVGVYRVAEFMGTSDFVADVPYSEIDYPNYESALSAGIDAVLELLEEKL